MKRRIIGMVTALVLAVIGTSALVAYVRTAEDRALADEELVDVFVVKDTIAAGTDGTALVGQVDVEQVPAKVRIEDAVVDLGELEGLVAAVDLLPGEQLTRERFVEPSRLVTEGLDVPAGLLEVTVSLAPERALGGRLVPGQTVAVVASFDPFDVQGAEPVDVDGTVVPDRTPNSSHIILGPVLVTNVQVEEGFDGNLTGSDEEDDDEEATPTAPTRNVLVTMAVDAASVERVVFAAEHGTVWLAHQPEGADLDGTSVQDRGTVYLPTDDVAA